MFRFTTLLYIVCCASCEYTVTPFAGKRSAIGAEVALGPHRFGLAGTYEYDPGYGVIYGHHQESPPPGSNK